MIKRTLWGLAGLAAVVAVAGVLWGDHLLLRLMQQRVTDTLSGTAMSRFGDGLDVVLCGAGSPIPDPHRSGPCVAVIADGRIFIFDAGAASVRNLMARGIGPGRIERVFLTHFHSDHIDGLGELFMQRWAGGHHDQPVPVHGPEGVARVVDGFNEAYALDAGYRVAHHGPEVIPSGGAGGIAVPFDSPPDAAVEVVFEGAGLVVTAVTVAHPPIVPAVAYRVDYRGRSVVISGDTVQSAALTRFARGADLLVHEALAPQLVEVMTAGATQARVDHMAQITRDIHNYHATPVEAAEVAAEADVNHLLYYHIVPALPLRRLEALFLAGVDEVYHGGVTVGRDGTWAHLPAGVDVVTVEQF